MFIDWIEANEPGENTFKKLNEMFKQMRKSQNYSYKRHCMILQYEVLAYGLKSELYASMMADAAKNANGSDGDMVATPPLDQS